jgi:hypothetical protein
MRLSTPTVWDFRNSLAKGDVDAFIEQLNSLFARIPYALFLTRSEAYYHSITYISLQLLGYYVRCEVQNHRGRLDALVETEQAIYIMEFKVGKEGADQAIAQIRERGYAQPYASGQKPVRLVGICFDPEQKGVGSYRVEDL